MWEKTTQYMEETKDHPQVAVRLSDVQLVRELVSHC